MATLLKTKVAKNIGTTPIDVLQSTETNRVTLIGCNLANIIDDPITVDLFVIDDTSTAAYYIKGIIIPANTSLKVITNGEKLILGPSCGFRVVSNTEASVDVIISYADIT
jgi:hypothetical protein